MRPHGYVLQRSALAECGRLDGLRLWGRILPATLLALVIASFVAPWTQTVPGDGRVIAYSPDDRETPVVAPVDGRVVRWYVLEGERVEAGQVIAELADNDPQLLDRLGAARDAVLAQGRAIDAAIRVAEEQVDALTQARDAALAAARLEVSIARDHRDGKRQQVNATVAKERAAALNLDRQRALNAQDLASDRELELAELAAATATSELDEARASLRAAERAVAAAEATLTELREQNRASIEKARGELEKLRADGNKVAASAAEAETKVSRQEQMLITAPRAGQIQSITARQGSDFVKAGQPLAMLVPDTADRAVELWVDGNDAPLIGKGRKVRLQFEGWPAVQFVGWPSVAVGTFGGEVAFVDPAARADGRFRVVVVPDPHDQPWPASDYLRQGARTRGWVLLNRVTVAFELWRQLNGFPPATQRPPDDGTLGAIARPEGK